MALSPVVSVPVAWQSAVVDLVPTSRYGAAYDTALVETTLALDALTTGEVVFALPLADLPDGVPAVELLPLGSGRAELDPTVPAEVEADLGPFEFPELWAHVKDETRGGTWRAALPIDRRDQIVRVSFAQRVPPSEEGGYELRLLAPLASLLKSVEGAESTVAIGLPHLPDRLVTVHYGYAENPPGEHIESATEKELAKRRFVALVWEDHDPLFRLRYAYSRLD